MSYLHGYRPVMAAANIFRKKIHNVPIVYVKETPCVEGLLLEILGDKKFRQDSWTSTQTKKHFEENYLDKKSKLDTKKYEKCFPKDLLIKRAAEVHELRTILGFLRVPL